MSTRSAIIAKQGENYRAIYCHSDGYIDGVGLTLLSHYTDPQKVNQLISLGDLSSVHERVAPDDGETHHFDYGKRASGVTVAYCRDRGEPLHITDVEGDIKDFIKHVNREWGAEYSYVWDGEKWLVARGTSDLVPLNGATDEVEDEE